MDINHTGVDPVSIKAEENFSTNWSGWLDPVPHIGTAEKTKFWTFISLWRLLDFKLLGSNLLINLILVSYITFDNKLSTG